MPPHTAMHGKQLRKFGESLHYKRLPSVKVVAFVLVRSKEYLWNKGAHTPLMGVCALRKAGSPDIQMSGLSCVNSFRTRDCTSCGFADPNTPRTKIFL